MDFFGEGALLSLPQMICELPRDHSGESECS